MDHHWSFYLEAIDIKELSVNIDLTTILNVDSFNLSKGQIIYINGHSGSGKSIFFKSLIQLLPTKYKKFEVNSIDISKINPHDLRLKIMYLNQQPQFPEGEVKDLIKNIYNFKINKEFSHQYGQLFFRYYNHLQDNDKTGTLDTANLSGGETQIVQICLALVLCQEILILDEAFSAMDRSTHYKAEQLVKDWFEQPGKQRSIIFASHQPELSKFNPHESYIMDKGILKKN